LPKDGTDEKLDRKEPRFSARFEGFDVHCAVRIGADDDAGRERLLRYCARPPFAVDRIEELPDGRSAYAVKTPRRGATHRVMTPMEFMGRLAILVPPPFFPLVRYHGVWQRLLEGELCATSSRVEWAILLQRTFGVDALRCPSCEQRMRVLSTITEPAAVNKILAHLGMRTEPLPRATMGARGVVSLGTLRVALRRARA
jgi:hypothetical protein